MDDNNYPPYNKNEIEGRYICPVCNGIYRNVHQADCGDRYCLECLEIQLPKAICAICNEAIPVDVKVRDRAFQKELDNMALKCVKCDWNGRFVDYRKHYKEHEEVKCIHCNLAFANEDLLKNHLDGLCEQKPMHCMYSTIGCDSSTQFVKNTLAEHSSTQVDNHLKLVYTNLNSRVSRVETQLLNIQHFRSDNLNESLQASNIISIESAKSEEAAESSTISTQKTTSKSKPQRAEVDNSNKKSKPSDSDVSSKMSMLEYNLKCANEDLTKYIHFSEKLSKEIDECKTNEKKLKEDVDTLQKNLTFAQATIISLEERLLAQEKASYNGTLVWKITNVRDKIQEAKSGRQTSIYSPPFYTHQNGFKMCGRIYLNGDGMGRNTHVSLFFVIMRGEYDALLRWPFRQKVTFILLDQSTTELRENIIDAFRPDPNSNSFKRPTSDMNIASGIPLFCPLSKLNSNDHEYTKDDCIFIKIIVDSRDLIDI